MNSPPLPAFPRLLLMTLAAWAGLAGAARAADCAFAPAPAAGLQSPAAVGDYRPVLKACVAADGRKAVAIREMTVAGQKLALLADPEALTTRLERAACWTCSEMSEDELKSTRMGRAISELAEAPGLIHRGFLQNAGLTHGAAAGRFPHRRSLPEQTAARPGAFSPGSKRRARTRRSRLSISGLWLIHHFADFRWLVDQRNSGRARHPVGRSHLSPPLSPQLPDAANFLLTKGVDPEAEILDTERLLIANGETPSLFFRFPGLVSSDPLMQAVSRFHLVTLGADAWLAKGQQPERGSIVLVHPNGNEPKGLALFCPRPHARDDRRAARAADRGAGVGRCALRPHPGAISSPSARHSVSPVVEGPNGQRCRTGLSSSQAVPASPRRPVPLQRVISASRQPSIERRCSHDRHQQSRNVQARRPHREAHGLRRDAARGTGRVRAAEGPRAARSRCCARRWRAASITSTPATITVPMSPMS